MDYNFHTHTVRCRHAIGTEEEYIIEAIKCGIKHLGFSEHMPFAFSDGFEGKSRVPVAQAQEYVSTLCDLREKYKKDIEIKIGFEMEYYPNSFEQMLAKAKEYGAEYLLLGQHFLCEEYPGVIHTNRPNESVEDLKEYVSRIISGIESGVFTYVAHPDVFNFIGDEEIYKREMRKIIKAALANNTPLEINLLGIQMERNYPNMLFWKMAGEEQVAVTIGSDCHGPQFVCDKNSYLKAMEIVDKYNLNYIGKPELKSL